MCGIVGSVGTNRDISTAIASLHHRGPDSHGDATIEIDGTTIQLGHTRLAILDITEAGHQPMWSRDGRWCITFNGEIFNHLDIRKDIDGPFRGHSDTETLVEALAKFGLDAIVDRLNGMFAFGAVDIHKKKFYLVRGRFGIKCVYYTTNGPNFAFASEVRALKALGLVSGKLDPTALQTLMSLRFVPSPDTLWADVRRLGPGEILELDLITKQPTLRRYTEPTADKFQGTIANAVDAYRDVLQQAVNRQMLSDVPLGLFLSGGIDSALLAAVIKNSGHAITSYTVGFGDNSTECEIIAAAHTANVLGIRNHAITVTADDLHQAFTKTISQIEEPLGTTSVLPMWYLCQLARKDVKVVLSGQGSDEPWGGYRRYQLEIMRSKIPSPFVWRAIQAITKGKLYDRLPEFARKAIHAAPIEDRAKRYAASYELFSAAERKALIGTDSSGNAVPAIQYWLDRLNSVDTEETERMLRIDTSMNLSDDLLLYTDKISMAFALEARVPMLDNELIRFVESLPLSYRASLSKTKIVHRMLAKTYLPAEIVNRPKRAFQVPFGSWLKNEWRAWGESILFDNNSKLGEVIDQNELRLLWNKHISGVSDQSTKLFTLLALGVWLEQCR